MKIQTCLDRYKNYLQLERRYSPNTVSCYLSDLRHLSVWFPDDLRRLTADDLREYMQRLTRRGNSPMTIHRKFHGFSTFFRWARRKQYIAAVLTDEIDLPRPTQYIGKFLSEPELKRFVEGAHVALKLLAWLGIRRGELLALDVDSINLAAQTVIVRGKGNKDRVLPLPESLLPDLRLHIGQRTAGPLFVNQAGRRWQPRDLYHLFESQLESAHLAERGYTPHALRHTVATLLHDAGVDIDVVRRLLGHQDIKTTLLYTHSTGRLREALESHPLAL